MSLPHALNMGSRSLSAQQRGVSTAGHNIANQNTEGFSRQEVSTRAAQADPSGLGAGAEALPTKRVYDQFLQRKILQESPRSGRYGVREDVLTKLEVIFDEMNNNGLRRSMNDFWDSWAQLANHPESDSARAKARDMGDRLATRFRDTNAQLRSLRNETNSRIGATVETINEHARKLQELNRQIFSYEAGGGRHANDARDERDRTLETLSKLVDLNWVEGKDGMLTVFIGRDWTLVQGNKANELVASLKGGEIGMYRVEGKLSRESRRDITEIFRAGEMQELTEVRDKTIVKYMDDLNDLAFGLTSKINQLHATGTGLKSASNMMKSAYGLNAEARLQPLPFLKDGIFQLHLVDRENEFVETYEIEIQAGRDTLNDIVQRINQTVNAPELLYASVEEDGSMFIQTGTDYKFIFGDDKTDLTQVLGFNSFFETLKGAEDLRLSDRIMLDPNTISTGRDLYPGDNRVALDIAKLQTDPHMRNDTMTFDEFYNTILADLGLRIQRNQTEKAQQDSLVNQFSQIRSSISGVNMDEELAKMMQYQKAYEASARFVGTVDQMMDTLVRM